MAVRLLAEPADLLRCRFALSPLWETVAAVRTLTDPRRQAYHSRWLRRVRPHARPAALAPLLALLPRTGFTPDFLTPPPPCPLPDIGDELDRVAATRPDRVAAEVHRSLHGPERRLAPPPEVAAGLLADPARTLAELVRLLGECWELLVAPQWPRMRDVLEADIALRSRRLAEGGLQRMVDGLHPAVRWHEDDALHVASPYRISRRLGGRGLLLLPSVFVWPALTVVADRPWQPTVVYPVRGVGDLWGPPAPAREAEALGRLIGRTRARILTGLDEPSSTGVLARRHGLGAASVSAHLTALRDAGLVTGHRAGRFVRYARTELGDALAGA
ncbi:DUF5937 family protein [Streptomyces sp. TRM 70351]|uniref:ArsR/SmtB family transcription factor n=1 Tax=Streptomyces sp. TRM 70351 TaxID=3116552 RepID=UPI002E7B2BB6|nr:DUF5937 family protein [Streptomyces sp. TRM 70351]MEE1931004.1 DUF5937 family protein [Streptomyces sp. TRM 70351]